MSRSSGSKAAEILEPFLSLIRRGWTAARSKGIKHFLFVSIPIGFRLLKNEVWMLVPEPVLNRLLPIYWRLSPSDTRVGVARDGDFWTIRNRDGSRTRVPSLRSPVCFSERGDRIGEKYCLPDFVEIATGDTVVDVGSFVGEFTDYAVRQGAGRVIAIEPDRRSYECTVRNTDHCDQVEYLRAAVWSSGDDNAAFHLASDPSESSLFAPDQGRVAGETAVPTVTVDDVARESDLDRIDFLKVEGEGVELEILQGIEETPVQKLAIDAGEENPGGEIPREAIKDFLTDHGYEVREEDRIVFARRS